MSHSTLDALTAGAPAGRLELLGRLVDASNGTFLARDEAGIRHLYKPVRGEAPLRDFPSGTLAHREVATFWLSRAAGFDVVPPTWWIDEGPLGEGSAQLWIEDAQLDLVDLVLCERIPADWLGMVIGADEKQRPVALVHADHPALRRLSLFDAMVNNADRKGGHVLHRSGDADVVLGCDHGLTFHTDDKLRTVLWGWADEGFTADELALLHRSREVLEVLEPWLAAGEIEATGARIDRLITEGTFPEPGERWPIIPWPPL